MSDGQNAYTGLITPYHAGKPRFVATVYATTQPLVDIQAAFASMAGAFDLDTAIGAQLDAIAYRVGTTRQIQIPNEGIVSLSDDQLRLLVRAKIAANTWDGTTTSAAAIYASIFPGLLVFIQDNQDMSMIVGISGTIPSDLTETLLLNGYLPLKPEGVMETNVITSVDATPLFGLDVESQYVAGFDVGACDRVLGTA